MANVSILILTKNEAKNIDRCIGAVFEQETNLSVEVCVVDSGSTDGTLERLEKYPIRLLRIQPHEFHHSRTRNFIAEQSSGELLVYLAGDAWPTSKFWLTSLVASFRHPEVGATYGRHMPKPGCSLERVIALSQLYGDEHISKNFQNRAGQGFRFYHFSTVNCAIRREIWRTFRFPEDQPVFEDIAIAKRILDAGWTIAYEPLAAVYHSHDYGAGMLFRRFFDSGVIWKQLGISDDESLQAVRSIGYQGFITKIHELRARECGIAELSRALARDLAKGVGFLLGQNERFLPISLKRRLSAFHIFS